jgi:hypothetical protein
VSNVANNPPEAKKPQTSIAIDALEVPGIPRVYNMAWHGKTFLATTTLLLAGTLAAWLFGYTFWVLLEGVCRALGWERGHSLALQLFLRLTQQEATATAAEGWPLDVGIVLGIVAASGSIYLGFDRLASLGNARAEQVLLQKAEKSLGANLPFLRHFVELRRTDKALNLPTDIGWLFYYPDRLVFVGDEIRVIIPRTQVAGTPVTEKMMGGLSGACVVLKLVPPYGSVLILPRLGVHRASDASELAPELLDTVRKWVSGH